MNLQNVTVFKCRKCNDRKVVFEGSKVVFNCPFCEGVLDDKGLYPIIDIENKPIDLLKVV